MSINEISAQTGQGPVEPIIEAGSEQDDASTASTTRTYDQWTAEEVLESWFEERDLENCGGKLKKKRH